MPAEPSTSIGLGPSQSGTSAAATTKTTTACCRKAGTRPTIIKGLELNVATRPRDSAGGYPGVIRSMLRSRSLKAVVPHRAMVVRSSLASMSMQWRTPASPAAARP